MAFELKKITEDDLNIIFPEGNTQIKDRRKATRVAYLRRELVGIPWARDDERDAFLTWAFAGKRDVGMDTWTFGWEGGTAIICMRSYCLFEFYDITEDLLPKIEELQSLIAEALSVSALTMEGNDNCSELDLVPDAKFLPYLNKGM